MRFCTKAVGLRVMLVALAPACGGTIDLGSTDPDASTGAHTVGTTPSDGGTALPLGAYDGGTGNTDASVGSYPGDASVDSYPSDAGPDSYVAGGAYVDAGYYYGVGSYWVGGGAYPDLPDAAENSTETDAAMLDASSACGSLGACCGSLSTSLQSLCNSVVASGNDTNCSTELTQLQGDGNCTGVSVLASNIQIVPNQLVSDGTTLFWTTTDTPGLAAMPVRGGPITTLLNGTVGSGSGFGTSFFLAVDDVNVYVLLNFSLVRIPKNGAAPTLVTESGAQVITAAALGSTAYWIENASGPDLGAGVAAKSAPLLLGGSVSLLATFNGPASVGQYGMGVTASEIVIGLPLSEYPISADPPAGGVTNETGTPVGNGQGCALLASDTDAVYCTSPLQQGASNLRVASDGTLTSLGPALSSSNIVFDDTYAYWADDTTVGTIMKAPKAGGGTATVIARDTSPNAIAIDAHAIYWSDLGGYIKSIPK
jgi:hypothetical protein